MAALITQLIDKTDTVELVRDQIAAILAIEIANQQQLAIAASKDPALWKLRVYTERSNPWDLFIDSPEDDDETSPIVNVWWDNSVDDEKASNVVEEQKVSATYHLDCYGYGVSREIEDGHSSGDENAALEAARAKRLVRNILMAGPYTYLGMRGVVGRRWCASAQAFQPPQEIRPVQHVNAIRLAMRVDFQEFSPQVQPRQLELLTMEVKRAEDGQILFEASYPQESS